MIYFFLIPLISFFFIFQLYRKPHFYVVSSLLMSLFCFGALVGVVLAPGLLGVEAQGGLILMFSSGWLVSAYLYHDLSKGFEGGGLIK